jgi:hypothetical protein
LITSSKSVRVNTNCTQKAKGSEHPM